MSLRLMAPGLTLVQAQALADQVRALRDAGKKVFCLLDQAGHAEYVVAAAADRIGLAPAGGIDLVGLAADVYFIKGLLDKLGIQADFVQMGVFWWRTDNLTPSATRPAGTFTVLGKPVADPLQSPPAGR